MRASGLRDRCADGSPSNAERFRDLFLGQPEVVVGDDDRPLPLAQEDQQLADLEATQHLVRRVLGRPLPDDRLLRRSEQASPRLFGRCARSRILAPLVFVEAPAPE